jgi:hypothetical protein
MIDTSKFVNKETYLVEHTPGKFLEHSTYAWWREDMKVFWPSDTNSNVPIEIETVLSVYGPIDVQKLPLVVENPNNPFKNVSKDLGNFDPGRGFV